MSNAKIQELANQARAYDRINNEGGEGFNPFWRQHEEAVMQATREEIEAMIPRWQEIRAAWNAAVAKYTINGKVDVKNMPDIEREAGVTQNQISRLKSRMAQIQ